MSCRAVGVEGVGAERVDVLEDRGRKPGELVGGGLAWELVEGELGVDRVPVDDRVGDQVQAVRLGGLALERV